MSASMFEPSCFITALYLLSDFSQRTNPLTRLWSFAFKFKGLERALINSWFPIDPEILSQSRYSQTPRRRENLNNCLTWQSNDKRKVRCCKLFWNLCKSQSHTPYLFAGLPALFVIFSFFVLLTTLNCSIRSFQLDCMHTHTSTDSQITHLLSIITDP